MRPALLLLAAFTLSAQAPKQFDVATIKPNAENDRRILFRILPGGGFSATGITAKLLIAQAYNVKDFQISGGPGWISTDRFDIQAKAEGLPERLPPEVFRPYLQSLLEERFQLQIRRESKEMPVYALVLTKGTHKMKVSEGPAGPGPGRQMMRMGRGQMNLQGATMGALANALSQQLGRPVIDKTGLSETFDIELHWTAEPGQGGGPLGNGPAPEAAAAGETSGPSLFTAIQDVLGLRLEAAKGPVENLIVDRISKPTEN